MDGLSRDLDSFFGIFGMVWSTKIRKEPLMILQNLRGSNDCPKTNEHLMQLMLKKHVINIVIGAILANCSRCGKIREQPRDICRILFNTLYTVINKAPPCINKSLEALQNRILTLIKYTSRWIRAFCWKPPVNNVYSRGCRINRGNLGYFDIKILWWKFKHHERFLSWPIPIKSYWKSTLKIVPWKGQQSKIFSLGCFRGLIHVCNSISIICIYKCCRRFSYKNVFIILKN